jgi:predicted transcriptional regulator
MLIGIFIYLAAAAEGQTVSLRSMTEGLLVRDAMETAGLALRPGASLAEAVDALLASPQRELPVVDENGTPRGLVMREGLIRALHARQDGVRATDIMEETGIVAEDLALTTALDQLNRSDRRALLVTNDAGRFSGLLTSENVGEMMLVHHADPTFRFRRPDRFRG